MTNTSESSLSNIADLFDKHYDSHIDNDEREDYLRQAESILSRLGYTEKLHGGTFRDVYASEETVIKIASKEKNIWGSSQKARDENASEIRNNTRISNSTIQDVVGTGECSGDKYITDIINYEVGENRWIIMERAEVTSNNVSHEIADKVQNALSSADPYGIHISEISPINMGQKNGIPVIFDYAGK